MSFYGAGTALGQFIERSSGLISSTSSFTILFALKIHTLRSQAISILKLVDYSGTPTAHVIATESNGLNLLLYSNYLDSPTTDVVATLVVGDWNWVALRGNGTNVSISITSEEGTSWTTETTTQSTFTPTNEYFISSDADPDDESGKVAVTYIREWNAVLSDGDLLNEIASASAVYSSNLVTDNDGDGADLAEALVSEVGSDFADTNGGITYNADQPSLGTPPPEGETITISGEVDVAPQLEITNATLLADVISFNGNYVSADVPANVTVSYQLYQDATPYSAPSAEFNSLSGTFTGILSSLPDGTYTVEVTVEDSYGSASVTSDPLIVEGESLTIVPYTEDEFVGPLSGWTTLYAPNDGVSDATSTIQTALDALVSASSSSTVLYVPAGTYRITSTLTITSGLGITIVGEDPESTTFVWDGASDGKMIYMYGTAYSRIARITFDGSGTARDLIHNFKELSGSTNYVPTLNEFRDCQFKSSKYGLRNGNTPTNNGGSSASHVIRCLFQNCTLAGIAQQDSSTLNWFIWDCAFYSNAHGITNYYGAPEVTGSGAGNFSVYRCVFKDNTVADMSIGNVGVFSARECDSDGSDVFFKSLVTLSATANVGLYNNIVRTVGVPVQFGVPAGATGCPGTLVLIDNQLKRGTSGTPVVLYSTATYTDVVSVGNIYSGNPTITSSSSGARLLTIDDVVSGGIGPSTKTFIGFAPKVSRTVYEVTSPTASSIQAAINSASSLSNKAYVHIYRGQWDLTVKLTIPENSDITLIGDGGMAATSVKGSSLRWTGAAGSTMLEVRGPTRARIRDLGLNGNASAAKGIVVANVDQSSGRVLFDQLRISDQITGNGGCLYVDPLDFTRVNVRGLFHYQSVNYPSVTVNGSDVRIWGGVAQSLHSLYSVQNNGKLVAANVQYDQASTRAVWFENGSGDSTILGHSIAPYLKDGLKVSNQAGLTTFLSSYFTGTSSPSSELQFTFGGTDTTKVGFIGNKVLTSTAALISSSGTPEVTLVENLTMVPSGTHSKYPDTTVDATNRVRAHLAQIRSVSLPLPQSTVLNNTDLRFDRVGVKQVTTTGVFVQSGGLGDGSSSGGDALPPTGVMQWIVQTTDTPVAVPSNFVGMHFNSRPLGVNVAPEPTFGYGTVRSHDWDPAGSGGPQWLQIEPVQGVYNTSEISAWASFYQGRRRIWTWGATPLWAASSTNTTSTWGPPGSNTPPSNLSYVNGTIQRVLDTTGVEVIEIWNEPEPHPDYPGWFYGNPTQLANMTIAAVNAVGNRNVTILGPTYTDFDGTTGAEWKIQQLRAALPGPTYDGFSWHWYDYEGNVTTTAMRLHDAIVSVRSMVTTHFGSTMPLWLTEIGAFNWSAVDSWSDQDHANAVARWLLVSAAHRQQTCCLYMYEAWYAGYPQGTPVVQAAIANAHTNVAGKTIRQAAILIDGSVWVEFSDGSQVLDGVQTVAPDSGTPTTSQKQFVFFQLF